MWNQLVRLLIGFVVLIGTSAPSTGAETCSEQEFGKVTATREGAVIAWSDCTDGSRVRRHFEIPARAGAFPYPAAVLNKSYNGGYFKSATKVDIVWADTTIEITRPLRSFGGDILLIADRIVIRAPIDSRLYIEHDVDHFEPDRRIGTGNDCSYVLRKTSAHVGSNAAWISAFRDYWLRTLESIDGETRFPELPGGLGAATPPSDCPQHMPRNVDGFALPDGDVSWQTVKSGNVWLIAKTIEIDPTLLEPSPNSAFGAFASASTIKLVPFAINAGGLRGARGGAGSASRCPYPRDPNNPFGCAAVEETGGLSAPGGRGGDAGNVSITLLSETEAEFNAQRSLLARVTNVAGGEPGSAVRFRSPATSGPRGVTGDRLSFAPEGEGSRAASGAEGHVDITKNPIEKAVAPLFLNLVRSKEMRFDYDYFVMAHLAQADRDRSSLRPASIITRFFAESLRDAQLSLIDVLNAVFVRNARPSAGSPLPFVLSGVASYIDHEALSPEQRSILNELRKLDGPASTGVLLQSGGLFNVASRSTATARMRDGQLRAGIALSNLALLDIATELREVNVQLFRGWVRTSSGDLLQRLERARAAIAALEAEVRRQQDKNNDVGTLLADLKSLGEGLVQVGGGIASENYVMVVQGIIQSGQSVDRLSRWGAYVAPANLTDLNTEVAAVLVEMVAFQQHVGELNRLGTARELAGVSDVLNARAAITTKLASESFLLPDLAKVAVISYFADPSRNRGDLRSNLDSLSIYLRGFPYQEPFVHLRDFEWLCGMGDVTCRTFEPSTACRVVYTNVVIDKRPVEVPLYVLAPTQLRKDYPLFGIPPSQVLERSVKVPPAGTCQ